MYLNLHQTEQEPAVFFILVINTTNDVDWVGKNIHHGNWLNGWLPERVDSSSYECTVQQD